VINGGLRRRGGFGFASADFSDARAGILPQIAGRGR
jgi:hypothetical protein